MSAKKLNNPSDFDYHQAFCRNLGWLTPEEQEILRHKTVAIAGMGGVGGIHAITLARLGVGRFHIADFDHFEIHNFNRQIGASISSIYKKKVQVIADWIRDINPSVEIETFPRGIAPENFKAFFNGVDLYIDGLDFFVLQLREELYRYLEQIDLPSLICGPVAMGAASVNILPGKMSFDDYFGFSKAADELEKAILFALGLAPSLKQAQYIAYPQAMKFSEKKVSSLPMGVNLASAIATTDALKLMLNRGQVLAAPHSLQYDPYLNRLFRSWTPFGWRNPLQRFKFQLLKKKLT